MKIHFVCSGNTNRSRMAEAYLNSKKLPGIIVSSSGIYANDNWEGSLSRYAERILTEHNLLPFAAKHWTQTTVDILDDNDLVVFMRRHHYDYCVEVLRWQPKNYLIWNIDDIPTNPLGDAEETVKAKAAADEGVFGNIVKEVDKLVLNI